MMKKILFAISMMLPLVLWAQEEERRHGPAVDKLHFETRLAWEGDMKQGKMQSDNSGFKGQFFNLRFDGQIVDGLTFSYRQRLSKQTRQTFWDATDWLHLDWRIDKHWGLSAGKQVVAIGGYEYDRAPIDLYYCSEFWNQIACYQLGVSASYRPADHDQLLVQLCNNPFRSWTGNNTYAINLMWYGQHGWWETMWSINAMQRGHGHWMNYIALGNRFKMGDKVHLDLDVMNRAASHQAFLFKDCSVMTELSYQPHPMCRLFGKYTYDQNRSGTDADLLVTDGTRLHMGSIGLEAQPVKKYPDALRLFAVAGYNWGRNTNPDGVKQDRQLMVQAGLKFRLDIIDAIHEIKNWRNKKEK